MKITIIIGLFLLVGASAFAGNQYAVSSFATTNVSSVNNARARAMYAIKSVKVNEVVPTAEEIYGFSMPAVASTQTNQATFVEGIEWDKIIMIGEKIIDLIKQGAPVVNIKRDAVYAIPKGLTDWTALSGWQIPVTKVYQVQMANGFNMTMVDVRVKVSAMYGGSYMDRGKYLANVVVVPTSINVKWGVTFDLWTENRDPVNMGSMEAPLAGLGFDIRYKAKTWVTEINGTQDYFISGAGEIRQMQ